jgi:hypothetical protein
LTAAAEHDAAIHTSVDDGARDGEADWRIVDRRLAIGPVVVDHVSQRLQCFYQVLFEQKAGVIGADCDSHNTRLYTGFQEPFKYDPCRCHFGPW